MLLNYENYVALGGMLSSGDFIRAEGKAEAYLNRMTHNRIRDETPARPAVLGALAELIDVLHAEEQASGNGSGISSQSNDGVSVTYTAWTSVRRNWAVRKKSILAEHLIDETDARGVPLLYAGVDLDGGDDG